MRTHRLKITCNCAECADYLNSEILSVDFCDATHWYCGLDYAGEDMPDDCVIYQGTLYPNVVYVECNLDSIMSSVSEFKDRVHVGRLEKDGVNWNIDRVEVEELDHYAKIRQLTSELTAVRNSIKSNICARD